MTPELGKLLGQTKRLRVSLYVDANGELKCVRVPGTNSVIPDEFRESLAKNREALTALFSSPDTKQTISEAVNSAACDRQCGDCFRWESMYLGHPPSGNVCRAFDLRGAA